LPPSPRSPSRREHGGTPPQASPTERRIRQEPDSPPYGISFGGVIAFIFADLIVFPILNIYRKYYGLRVAGFLLVTFYMAMVAAALAVELLFQALGLVPEERNAKIVEASVTWNYTTVLNIIFIIFAAVLVWRFVRTGGLPMLRMMNKPMSEHA
jgi:uncharacterized membrane protein YraQ (UPF0718 family)